MAYFTNDPKKEIEKAYKDKLLNKALQALGNITWIKDQSSSIIPDDEIQDTDLFKCYDKRETDDEFTGQHNGVNFKISETKLIRSKGNAWVFKGAVVAFKCNKIIKNRTIITLKGELPGSVSDKVSNMFDHILETISALALFITGVLCFLALSNNSLQETLNHNFDTILLIVSIIFCVSSFIIYLIMKPTENLNKVRLEDPKFRKLFNVYSSDQVEAKILITPAFMELFYNLKTAFKARGLKCSFYWDKLMISIGCHKDLFNIPNLDLKVSDEESLRSFYNQLSSIYKLIDYLQLDSNTYSQPNNTSTEHWVIRKKIG